MTTDLERTIQNNWALVTAIREYVDAQNAVRAFIRGYLRAGGDPTHKPQQWEELDAVRQEKYAAMLKVAGIPL